VNIGFEYRGGQVGLRRRDIFEGREDFWLFWSFWEKKELI